MQGYVRHVSNNPAVVWSRSDTENCARQQIKARSVFILNDAMSGEHSARVRRMAKAGSGYRRVVDGPLPSGWIRGAAERNAGYVHEFKSAERELANLIRLRECP